MRCSVCSFQALSADRGDCGDFVLLRFLTLHIAIKTDFLILNGDMRRIFERNSKSPQSPLSENSPYDNGRRA